MEIKNKQKGILRILLRYVALLCISTVILIGLYLILINVILNNGLVLPANYYEQEIEKNREKIAETQDVEALIPEECNYVVYDFSGNVVQGNVSKSKSEDIWKLVNNNRTNKGKYYYKIIKRKDDICVVEYTLYARFSSSTLNEYFGNAEYIMDIVFLIMIVGEIIVFARLFRKKIIKEMIVLKNTTENIQIGNLDFEVKYSNISEINEVILALDKMKIDLSNSLEMQWNMEKRKKEQIAALVHDIKTPLTIIKGNSELLSESNLKKDEGEFINQIISQVNNIEGYVKLLMEIIKSEKEDAIEKREVKSKELINDIINQSICMAMPNHIEFSSNINKNIPELIYIDEMAIKRTIINIISNAIEYCTVDGKVLLTAQFDNKFFKFIIEDSGRGFTNEELNLATEQFFRGDKSRNSKNHYGMGLYIAKKFAQKHNGILWLENSKELGGGKVTLEIPINLE